jgi:hypothetical protein
MYFSIKQFPFWHTLASLLNSGARSEFTNVIEPGPRAFTNFPLPKKSDRSTATHQVDDSNEQGNNKQDVYKAPRQMKGPSDKPQSDKDGE